LNKNFTPLHKLRIYAHLQAKKYFQKDIKTFILRGLAEKFAGLFTNQSMKKNTAFLPGYFAGYQKTPFYSLVENTDSANFHRINYLNHG